MDAKMNGLIGRRQVVAHFGVIWREFGPRCAVRCVSAIVHGRPTTFLDVAFNTAAKRRKGETSLPAAAAGERLGKPTLAPPASIVR
jgi:hypothetical protein